MLKTRVKASQIENLTDARYFAAQGVEWMGFPLSTLPEEKKHLASVNAIKAWIDGVRVVGEYHRPDPVYLVEQIQYLELEAIQIGHLDDPKMLEGLPPQIEKWQSVDLKNIGSLEKIGSFLKNNSYYIDFFLLDFQFNPSFINFDNSSLFKLKDYCNQYPIIMGWDFQPEELSFVLETIQPEGINLKGGTEEKIGFKSFDELDAIFEQLEILV